MEVQEKMKFREFNLSTGARVFLGKDAENNDELVKEFKGKENFILHTIAPGSPFCVIERLNPSVKEVKEAAIICASRSQDWRNNKSNVDVHKFTGNDVKKPFFAKTGTWKIINKPEVIKIKKREIQNLLKYKKQV
jgi:predicted ribosome quality control (RQC) complex YloA/Tae2 family protein